MPFLLIKFRRKKLFSLGIILFLFISIISFIYISKEPFRRIRKKAETSLGSSIRRGDDLLKVEFVDNYPLKIEKPIFSFSLDGDISLKTKKSFIRVVLVDGNKNEYLVYEAYPLIVDNNSFSIVNSCDETCVLDSIVPVSLKISGYRTSFTINKTSFIDSKDEIVKIIKSSDIVSEQRSLKKEKDNFKIMKLNENINKKGLKWTAGETSVSQKTYSQKKKMFSNPDGKPLEYLPNLQGFEYYKGGIFKIFSDRDEDLKTKARQLSSSPYPVRWDWRNVHGENWVTFVKNQEDCGSCWAFAATGATEAVVNLYFNQHLDYDLSEQDAVSCSGAGSCKGGWPGETLDYYTNVGVVNESCFPYQASNIPCNKCANWQNNVVKISGREDFNGTENWLKEKLLKKGVITSGIYSWGHVMALVGWDTDVDESETNWIFKNSMGDWGDIDYVRIILPINDIGWTHAVKSPIILPTEIPIICIDKDHDGYCNWGISETRPATCPASCRSEKDCDDSNPNSGYFDSNFNCTPCGPSNCSGCCLNNVCHLGTASQTCGVGGGACVVCGGAQYCQSGTCVNLPPTPVVFPGERCSLSVMGGANHIIGETVKIMVRQNPKFAFDNTCYYGQMTVKSDIQATSCIASGFWPGSQTRVCSWNTWWGLTSGPYSLSSFYEGHSDNCPDGHCCDNAYTCYASVVLSHPTPTSRPIPTPTTIIIIENTQITSAYDPCYSKRNERVVLFTIHTTPQNPNIKRVWVKRTDGGWIARDNSVADMPGAQTTWTTNFDPECKNDSHPWIITNMLNGKYRVKAVALTYEDGTIAESDETTLTLSDHSPTPVPTLTCVSDGGTVSDCSQCCSTHCETNPLGPTFCIP